MSTEKNSTSHQHDTDCSQVIHQIFTFIDNEMPQADCAVIQKHLAADASKS